MKKTIGYVRVSSGKQVKKFSLASQEKAVKLYAKERGYDNLVIVKDPGKSAKTLVRPGMQKIMEMVNNDEVERVIIIELDRMNRDVGDQSEFIKLLRKKSVQLEGVSEDIDINSPDGMLKINIKGAINQYDNDSRAVKTRRGLVEKAAQGQYAVGNIMPYGYRKNKKHFLIAINEEIEIIRKVFEYYVYHNLSEKKTAERIKAEYGKSFSKKNIYRFLAKPLYRGFIVVDDEERFIKCHYINSSDVNELNKALLSNEEPATMLKPIITEGMYEDFMQRKAVKGYSKQSYKYRNKVFINGVKAQHSKQKNRNGREYWYYYIGLKDKKIYVNQEQIDRVLRKKIAQIQYDELSSFSENVSTLSLGYANGTLEEKDFLSKLNDYRKHYERLSEAIERVDIRTIGESFDIEIK